MEHTRTAMLRAVIPAVLALVALTLAGDGAPASAASSQFNISLFLSVNIRCTLAVTDIVFANYSSGQSAPLDAVGSVALDCDAGRSASVRMSEGQNPDPGSTPRNPLRRLKSGDGDYLAYNLFEDAAHTTVWDNDSPGLKTARTWPVTLNVYGRISGGQIVPDAAYSDIVLVTVFF